MIHLIRIKTLTLNFVFLFTFGLSTLCRGADDLQMSPQKSYRQLRKDFLVISSLPPADKGFRKEHLLYLRKSTAFIRSLSADKEEDKPFLIATYSGRGALLLHCGRFEKAREDFDHALKLLPPPVPAPTGEKPEVTVQPQEDMKLPLGAPPPAVIRLYRAFTFAEEGAEKFIAEVSSLPPAELSASQDILREKVQTFAEKLTAEKKYAEAIEVYKVIANYSLWDEDKDQDPQRLIEIIRVQQENSAE